MMSPESKLPKKTGQELGNFSFYSTPCAEGDLLQIKQSSNARPLRVEFALPETDLEQAETRTTSKEIIAFPTLPSICEFTMFSSNQPLTESGKKVSQIRPLTKLPPMYSNARGGNIAIKNGAASGLTTHKEDEGLVENKAGLVTCTKQDLRIEVKCKLPEEYRDPTYKETKKRIWDWLKQSEAHQPAYLRRANAFRKTVNLDKSSGTQYVKTLQHASLTERI